MKAGFKIKSVQVCVKNRQPGRTVNYFTHKLTGWLNGRRVREQFKTRAEAEGRKNVLEVEVANAGGEMRARPTRLNSDQLAVAEWAYRHLAGQPLQLAVEWFLANYRPPAREVPLADAATVFLADRALRVRPPTLRDYRRTLRDLQAAFPARHVHEFTTQDVQAFLDSHQVGKKRWNNIRGDLEAFFGFCSLAPREWRRENPVSAIPSFKLSRGLPEIITAKTSADLMSYLEAYTGGPRCKLAPGALVPYFALCLFAGLRPSINDGEVRKLADSPDLTKLIDLKLGVIHITPQISKVKALRQIKIQPNLATWLKRYPGPIFLPSMEEHAAHVRKKFGLGSDVLRHSFISLRRRPTSMPPKGR